MTFDQLVRDIADKRDLPLSATRATLNAVFARIAHEVLHGDGRVNIPEFGVFVASRIKGGIRKIGPSEVEVPPTVKVKFRVAKGAKRRA